MPVNVRYCSNSDQECCSAANDAKCHKQTWHPWFEMKEAAN